MQIDLSVHTPKSTSGPCSRFSALEIGQSLSRLASEMAISCFSALFAHLTVQRAATVLCQRLWADMRH
jgi:hypothetical protein